MTVLGGRFIIPVMIYRQLYFLFVDLSKKVTHLESVQDTGAGDGQTLKVCCTEYCLIFP